MRKLACVLLTLLMLLPMLPISAADAAADLPDLIITKLIATTKSISGRSWPFNGTRDGFEAVEVVNTSGKELNLYAYGLCYNDSTSGIIKAVTPIKAGDFRDGSTWSLKDMFDGSGNPEECKLAPDEAAVLWLVNGDTTNYLKSGRIIKVSEFRNFYGIDEKTKVIAIDANATESSGDAGNFNMKNSVHNVIGIYKLDTKVTAGETTFAEGAESWAIRCTDTSHTGEKGCGIAEVKNNALLYVPVSGEKQVEPYAPADTENYADLAYSEYTLGVLSAEQKAAITAFVNQSGVQDSGDDDKSDEVVESGKKPDADLGDVKMPDLIMTKVVGTNARVEGEPWNYPSTPADAYEAIEIVNTSGKNLDLYEYGLCYENGSTGIIRAVTPFKPVHIQDQTTWRWSGMPVNPAACILRPQEAAVLWLVNQNSANSTIADFRDFHNIPSQTRIIAVDCHNSSEKGGSTRGNFNIKNSAHNVLGIYRLSAEPVVDKSTFDEVTESWLVRCAAHSSEKGYYPMNASTRSYAVAYIPVNGQKQMAVGSDGNLAYRSYTLGTLTSAQQKAIDDYLDAFSAEEVPEAEPLSEIDAFTSPWAGKRFSVLGDSVSTFTAVTNNSEYNTTIGGSLGYYTDGRYGVSLHDTWWQQVCDALGMELLVNNSWAGSCVLETRQGTVGAYIDRCVQLHNDHTGEDPDVITVFMGTNDFSYFQTTLDTADAIDYDKLIRSEAGKFVYAEPATTCEAYAIMLHKMTQRYPDAEIFCMTLLARRDPDKVDSYDDVGQPTNFNPELEKIIRHFGCRVVDLQNCGLVKDAAQFDAYIGDGRVHPNAQGMDLISEAVIKEMLEKEPYIFDVSFELNYVTADNTPGMLVGGSSYIAVLECEPGFDTPEVRITMGGHDVTKDCYADGIIDIESVKGDLVITASAGLKKDADSYRWTYDDGELVNAVDARLQENALTQISGSISNGDFNGVQYELSERIVLRHDKLWTVEWKCAGNWSGMLFSSVGKSDTKNMRFIFRTQNASGLIALGEYRDGQYQNYGVTLADKKMDMTKSHVYRIENRIAADGSNMVYLMVDGVELGALDNYYIGGTKDQGRREAWISGQDFVFTHIGTTIHPLKNMKLEYLQVEEHDASRSAG